MTYLPSTPTTWVDVTRDVIMRAADTWVNNLLPNLFPQPLTAAGEEQAVPPNLEAILSASAEWQAVATQELTPVIIAFMAAQTWDVTHTREIDLTPLSRAGATPAETRAAFAEARSILERLGYDTEDIDVVITARTWVDEVTAQVAVTPNRVAGMPESVYREVVTKLGEATQEGASQFERNLIVREVLDLSTEGGFEAWNTRADRIARTETNRIVNAGTMQAARMEHQVTGERLRKVWVATTDPRTRDEHFAADGQTVPLDGKFLIGGHEADYPGDPNLPPHLSINCRCTTLLLGEDEPLPSEADRQTERERADGTRRNPQDEVQRRAARGVTRDRDNDHSMTAAAKEQNVKRNWSGLLAPIGKPSGDGRVIDDGAAIEFREFPLPLMFQKEQSIGHDTSVIVGKIEAGLVEGGAINATGVLFDTPEALEAAALLDEGVIRPSVDLCDMVADYIVKDADGNEVNLDEPQDDTNVDSLREELHVKEATVMGATLVAKPAFAEAKILLGEKEESDEAAAGEIEALAASAAVATVFPASAFANPGLSRPTPLTVDGDRVFGHLAVWGTEHIGFPGKNITPPHSRTGYSMFHVSQVSTDEGEMAVGRLTVGTGHAEARDNMHAAVEHYDSTGTAWAYVRAGEDEHGIWVAGVVNPDAAASQVRAGASAPLSGDWRRVGGNLELVAALSVNTPGFPVPRTFSSEGDRALSMVAAAVVPRVSAFDETVMAVREALRQEREAEAAADRSKADAQRASEARRLAAGVMALNLSSNLNRGL